MAAMGPARQPKELKPIPRGSALKRTFLDALDDLEITYDTYWETDSYRPRCRALFSWLSSIGFKGRKVLIISPFPLPYSMLFSHFGCSVRSMGFTHHLEPWREIENQVLISDLDQITSLNERYDLILVDDLIQNLEYPINTLGLLRGVLEETGLLLLTSLNVGRITSRLRLLLGRNIYPPLDPGDPYEDEKWGPEVFPFREYTLKEADQLLRESGFKTGHHSYVIGNRAVVAGFHSISIMQYLARKAYYLSQMLVPAFRSHFFLAASVDGDRNPPL